ncbi:hypothetical protein HDU87_008237 [Geranomyces variabilis]|uniref:Uncharacterized protein n=1 Tax=Geranomyces variabilis TaxID=109894 RepID=A0AAD5XM95_9FUNG|nr:hypothetical protein HDU87_008237 [Geranomyces variabilis]
MSCCPGSRWAHSTGRGYPSHPTFDYDEIDDLEIENLLNMPSPFPSSSRRGAGPPNALWEKVAGLFRRPEHPRLARGGVESGGYQSVPTDNDASGTDAPPAGHPAELDDDDEFLRHEADAQLLSDDHIRQITTFSMPQPVAKQSQPETSPDAPIIVPPSPVIDPRDPLAGFLQSATTPLIHNPPEPSTTPPPATSQPAAPKPYVVSDGSFRPKKRTSAAASSAVSAAAMFGSAPSSSPPRDERGPDGPGIE